MTRRCLTPACARYTERTYCTACQRDQRHAAGYHTTAWRQLAKATVSRDGHKCVVCSSTDRPTAHHHVPKRNGGPDALWNLLTLCHACHNAVEAAIRQGRHTDLTRTVDGLAAIQRARHERHAPPSSPAARF